MPWKINKTRKNVCSRTMEDGKLPKEIIKARGDAEGIAIPQVQQKATKPGSCGYVHSYIKFRHSPCNCIAGTIAALRFFRRL